VAFGEALGDDFKAYARQVIQNARVMAESFMEKGYPVVSGGTDNHLMVVDMTSKGIGGRDAERILEKVGISVSRSTIPNDPNPPMNPSGVRFGTAAVTTRGMGADDMKQVVEWIDAAITSAGDEDKLARIQKEVRGLCQAHPIPSL
jgi:glycine hydroxymethyltransferase